MRPRMAKRLAPFKESVFEVFTALARQHDAVNLGSGTPDMPIPETVTIAVEQAIADGKNQYAPVAGEPALRSAVAAHSAHFYGQVVDPECEISITCGVTEGVNAALFSIVEPGDEIVVFEPFYDCYVPGIQMAGGIPIAVTLHAPSFRFDPRELQAAFSSRTKAILLNTPHNPTGTVFSSAELTLIAELCQEFDVLAITDEVYEHIVFDGEEHVRLATFPGMKERTLTLSGAGKTFSCTGWRIGWAIGPAPLQEALCRLRQFTVFAAPTPLQIAIAAGLRLPDAHYLQLAASYQKRRDLLLAALDASGLRPNRPAGGFFILSDISALGYGNGREFCQELAKNPGVAPIPMDTFYLNQRFGKHIARFTFSVSQEKLEIAAKRLTRLTASKVTSC